MKMLWSKSALAIFFLLVAADLPLYAGLPAEGSVPEVIQEQPVVSIDEAAPKEEAAPVPLEPQKEVPENAKMENGEQPLQKADLPPEVQKAVVAAGQQIGQMAAKIFSENFGDQEPVRHGYDIYQHVDNNGVFVGLAFFPHPGASIDAVQADIQSFIANLPGKYVLDQRMINGQMCVYVSGSAEDLQALVDAIIERDRAREEEEFQIGLYGGTVQIDFDGNPNSVVPPPGVPSDTYDEITKAVSDVLGWDDIEEFIDAVPFIGMREYMRDPHDLSWDQVLQSQAGVLVSVQFVVDSHTNADIYNELPEEIRDLIDGGLHVTININAILRYDPDHPNGIVSAVSGSIVVSDDEGTFSELEFDFPPIA
ncbi:MAG TPA: hypothetical protein VL688_08270 [Verrucomicrobiae bacterium]|nr:hypothetical protein [Verrucomicrobiae bacterium]